MSIYWSVVVTWIVFIFCQKGLTIYWRRAQHRGVPQFLCGRVLCSAWLFCLKAVMLLTKMQNSVFFNMGGHTNILRGFHSFKVLHLQVWSEASIPTETVTDTPSFSTQPMKYETFLNRSICKLYNCDTSGLKYNNDNFNFHPLCNTFAPPPLFVAYPFTFLCERSTEPSSSIFNALIWFSEGNLH